MNCTILRGLLLEALTTAYTGVARKTPLDVLRMFHLKADGELTVTGSDLERTVRVSCPVGAEEAGEVVVPAKRLVDLVKALPQGKVRLWHDTEAGRLIVEAELGEGREGSYGLPVVPAEEYPVLEPPSFDDAVEVDGLGLRRALQVAAVAVATPSMNRPVMENIRLLTQQGSLEALGCRSAGPIPVQDAM